MAKSVVTLAVVILGCSSIGAYNASCAAFGYELLMAKLEHLEGKIQENQAEMREQISVLLEQQRTLADQIKTMYTNSGLHSRNHPSGNRKPLQAYSRGKQIKSCKEVATTVSGRFWLRDYGFEVYCLHSFGGGWLVVQNRFNGSVSFNRNWTEYKEGFGSLDGEFWWGLEKIHQMTSSKRYELLVYLEDFQGTAKYAIYDEFSIGGEEEGYVLEALNFHSGSVDDSFSEHKGRQFFTPDLDNNYICAKKYNAGWWYSKCASCNLNGEYGKPNGTYTMSWYNFHGCYCSLKVSKMMIREKVVSYTYD